MANPTSRHTRARRDRRRAHWKRIALPNVIECPECGDYTLPHRVCPSCGSYRGRSVLSIKEKEI